MKKVIALIILSSFLLSGCSKEIDGEQLQMRGELAYEVNATSPYSGSVMESYDNGQIKLSAEYQNGKKHGQNTEYFDNGQIKFQGLFKEGELNGKYEEFHPNHNLKVRGEIVDGVGSEFMHNEQGLHYKTVSYENYKVSSEQYEDINDSYREMIDLSGLPFPSDKKVESNLRLNIEHNAVRVFDYLVFNYEECFDADDAPKTINYDNGNPLCSFADDTTKFFYPNGKLLAEWTTSDGPYFEEVFSISGKSCGQQRTTGKGEEYLVVYFPDCSINWEEWYSDGEIYLTKYHNQTEDHLIKNGHFFCLNSEGMIIYEGEDVNCLEKVAKAKEEERKRKAEVERKKKAEAERKRKAEVERKKKAEAERKRKAEVERKKKAEAERKKKAEAERKKKAEAERKRKAEADRKSKLEEEKQRSINARLTKEKMAQELEAFKQELLSSDQVCVDRASLSDKIFGVASVSDKCDEAIQNAFNIYENGDQPGAINAISEIENTPSLCARDYEKCLLTKNKRAIQLSIDTIDFSTDSDVTPIYIEPPRYPSRSQSRGAEGYAVVQIIVTTTGGIRNPVLIEEWPEGWGFGRSALKAANKLKYKPKIVDGVAHEREGVLMKYTFQMAK